MEAGEAFTLVATKMTAPTPPSRFAARPELEARLDQAASDDGVRVVLVSAPAGSGKSTLVAAWQQHRSDCAWLQADKADGDPARFWGHVVAALEAVVPGLEDAAGAAIPGSGADATALIERLTNELANTSPALLVIDDYHLIANPVIDEAVEYLIELSPSTFTLVLCTRLDPSVRLGRLRVRGQLAEIRAADLRFAPGDASVLLAQRGGAPSSQQVDALCERTEGWAAGLVLAGMSLAAAADGDAFVASFQGDDRLVVEYLTDEFLSGVTDDDRLRLLQTSVLDRMCGPLIDAVCETTDGTGWLEELATRNQLVVGLGRSSEWYRYHHLLHDVLRMKASASTQLDDLHRRAGAWHRDHGDLDRAAEHLLEAGDLDAAADVIAAHSMDLLNLGQVETVSGYLERLGTTVSTHLRCAVLLGWIHAVQGNVDEADRSLQHLRRLEATSPADAFASGLIAGLAVLIHVNRGDVDSAIADAAVAPEVTDATQTLVLGQAFVWGGRFDDAEPILTRAGRLAAEHSDQFALAGTPSMAAVAALESGETEAARRSARKTIAATAHHGAPEGGHSAVARSVLARTSADPDDARTQARRGVELARGAAGRLTAAYALAGAADVLCALDEADGPALAREARSLVDQCADPGIVGRYLARVEARHQLGGPAPKADGLVADLTEREVAVLRYLPSPMSQREIANELYVSLNTVKTHCKAIYRKLGVGDRKAAVQAARDVDLL
ncbi:MAG: LuxR C-terminal-related transcriptional regulator [Acidimicrobiales bacterium]